MAHINVILTDKVLNGVVFNDAFEFIAAAGNVAHTVAVFITPESLPIFAVNTTIRPIPVKALKSLVFYDVDDIFICANDEDIQPYKDNIPKSIKFAALEDAMQPGQKVFF